MLHQIKGIEVSENQLMTIDCLLSTHREIYPVDLVEYTLHGMAKGGKVLQIKTGEYWYSYKVMKNGSIAETRRSDNNISYTSLKYFQ